jgi:hypothetical protein
VTEPCRNDDRGRSPLSGCLCNGLRNSGWRGGDDHHVGRARDCLNRFDRCDAFDLTVVRVDHVNWPGKAGALDVGDDVPTDRICVRARTHDGDRTRRNKLVEAIGRHCSWETTTVMLPHQAFSNRTARPQWVLTRRDGPRLFGFRGTTSGPPSSPTVFNMTHGQSDSRQSPLTTNLSESRA